MHTHRVKCRQRLNKRGVASAVTFSWSMSVWALDAFASCVQSTYIWFHEVVSSLMKKDVYVATIYHFFFKSSNAHLRSYASNLTSSAITALELWTPLANHCLSQPGQLESGGQAIQKIKSSSTVILKGLRYG